MVHRRRLSHGRSATVRHTQGAVGRHCTRLFTKRSITYGRERCTEGSEPVGTTLTYSRFGPGRPNCTNGVQQVTVHGGTTAVGTPNGVRRVNCRSSSVAQAAVGRCCRRWCIISGNGQYCTEVYSVRRATVTVYGGVQQGVQQVYAQ